MSRRMFRNLGVLAAALVIVVLLPLSPNAWGKTLRVVVENVAFGAVPNGARVGDTIEWVNKDFVAHTATARDGSFDIELPPGKSIRLVLKHAGRTAFYCRYHPNMIGELVVSR